MEQQFPLCLCLFVSLALSDSESMCPYLPTVLIEYGVGSDATEEFHMYRFVVQEHHAHNIHWDFRLERRGLLKSWAVPKGPPKAISVKRLAIQVEDHDIDFIDIEGTIEEGEYGAGQVRIWDRGTYEMESESEKRIVFSLNGKRLKGRYTLVHMRGSQWLLIKLLEKG